MRPAENIEKLVKNINIDTNAKIDEEVLGEVVKAFEKSKVKKTSATEQNIGRIIMKSRITKLAAAAVVIAGTIIGLHWFGDGSPAYGITEALELWKNADIVHVKGWGFLRKGDDTQLQKFPFEIWYDKKNGRFKYWLPDIRGWPPVYTTETPRHWLHVSDGQYIMETGYRHSDSNSAPPLVMFIKLSPFEQRLQIRTMNPFPAYMANLNQVKGFTKVG